MASEIESEISFIGTGNEIILPEEPKIEIKSRKSSRKIQIYRPDIPKPTINLLSD